MNKRLDPRMKQKLIGENIAKISNIIKILVSENISSTECFFPSIIVALTYLWKHHRNPYSILCSHMPHVWDIHSFVEYL